MTTGKSVALRACVFLLLIIVLSWTAISWYRQWQVAKRLEAMASDYATEARAQVTPTVGFDDARAWLLRHGYDVIQWTKDDPRGWIGKQNDPKGKPMAIVAGQKQMTANNSSSGPIWVYLAFQFDPDGRFRELGAWPTMRPVQSQPMPTTLPDTGRQAASGTPTGTTANFKTRSPVIASRALILIAKQSPLPV